MLADHGLAPADAVGDRAEQHAPNPDESSVSDPTDLRAVVIESSPSSELSTSA